MVQDQLHLCIGKGPRRADQRGRDFHRHPVQRHMERHGAEHRCFRQRGGAGTVLAEHAGAVRQRHSIRKSGRRIRHRHRQCGTRLPTQIRPYSGRHSGPDHLERTVRRVFEHPVRQWHPQRLPRHAAAGGFLRAECEAGAVLAEDCPHRVHEP